MEILESSSTDAPSGIIKIAPSDVEDSKMAPLTEEDKINNQERTESPSGTYDSLKVPPWTLETAGLAR